MEFQTTCDVRTLQIAFERGESDGLKGHGFTANPYIAYAQERQHEAWVTGWVQGFQERHSDR